MSINNQEVYADGSELDLSPQTRKTDPSRRLPSFKDILKPRNEEETSGNKKNSSDEMQKDILNLLDRDVKTPVSGTNKWGQSPNEWRQKFSGPMQCLTANSKEFAMRSPESSYLPADLQLSHGRSQSQRSEEKAYDVYQKEPMALKFVTPDNRKMPNNKVVSVLSTETTFDADFLGAAHENLNTSSTTNGTHFSATSKKNSEIFQTPQKSGSETKLADVWLFLCFS